MAIDAIQGTYPTISHRAAAGYPRFLVSPEVIEANSDEVNLKARQHLHGFFKAFYQKLYEQPELFGLPLKPDDCITEDEPHEKEKNRRSLPNLNSQRR